MIEIRLYGPLAEIVDARSVRHEPDGDETVADVLRALSGEHPELADRLFEAGVLRESINVLKNGQNVKLIDGGETPVTDGDRLSCTVSLEGG